MHLTMIFVDGLGLGLEENNPVVMARTPHLDRLLGGHFLWGIDRVIEHENCRLFSLDATLGVPGIPQSATGQTALWTGVNTAAYLGYHLRGFPNDELKEIIKKESIFKKLGDAGKKATFANAFYRDFEYLVNQENLPLSASTLCTLAGGLTLRSREDLIAGKAVYQDITNEIFRLREARFLSYSENNTVNDTENQGEPRQEMPAKEEVAIVKAFTAGENLARISQEYDFTLFEYFQTDIRGHKRQPDQTIMVIESLDEFLGGYLSLAEPAGSAGIEMALILTSDHGNIEDLSTSTHTLNQVPALCWSNFGLAWPQMTSITDVTPAVLKILGT